MNGRVRADAVMLLIVELHKRRVRDWERQRVCTSWVIQVDRGKRPHAHEAHTANGSVKSKYHTISYVSNFKWKHTLSDGLTFLRAPVPMAFFNYYYYYYFYCIHKWCDHEMAHSVMI